MDDSPDARTDAPIPGDPPPDREELAEGRGDRRSAFVCHCSEADGAEAKALVRKLEALGISCWIAPRDLRGRTINKASVAGVKSCPFTIVLISQRALATTKFMVHEIHIAHGQGKKIIPVIRGAAAGNDLDEYSFYFANEAYIEVASFTDDDCVAELVKRIPHKEPQPRSPTVPPPAVARASSLPQSRTQARRLLTPLIVAAAVVIGFFVTLPFLRPEDPTNSKQPDETGKTASASGSHGETPTAPAIVSPLPDDATVAPEWLLADSKSANGSGSVDATVTITWPGVPEGWRVDAHAAPTSSTTLESDEPTTRPIDGDAGGWTFTFPVAPDPAPMKLVLTLIASPPPSDAASASGARPPVQVTRDITVVHVPSFRARDWARPEFDWLATADAGSVFAAATRIDEWFGRLPKSVAEATAAFGPSNDSVLQLANAIVSDARAEIDTAQAWIDAVESTRMRLSNETIVYNAESHPSVASATIQPGRGSAALRPFDPADLFFLVPSTPSLPAIAADDGDDVTFQIPIPATDGRWTYSLTRCDGVVMGDSGRLEVKRDSTLPRVAFAPNGRPDETLVIDRAIPETQSVTVTFVLDEPCKLIVGRPATSSNETPFATQVEVKDASKPVTVVVPLPNREAFEAAGSERLHVEIAASAIDAAGNVPPDFVRTSFVALDAEAYGARATADLDAVVDHASFARWNLNWDADLSRMPAVVQQEIRAKVDRNDYVERRKLGLLPFARSSKPPLEFEKKQARFWTLNVPSSGGAAQSIEFVELQGGPTTLEADPKLANPTRTYSRDVPRFLIATHETTNRLLDTFFGSQFFPEGVSAPQRRSGQGAKSPDQPAVGVYYETASSFIDWLNQSHGFPRGGGGFALPDEFEWRYACADLPARLAADPAVILHSVAAFGELDAPDAVGKHAANAFGIHDLLGNAAEWCQDIVVESPERESLLRLYGRPYAPVLRGGSYLVSAAHAAEQLNFSTRGWTVRGEEADVGAGFRIVFHPVVP